METSTSKNSLATNKSGERTVRFQLALLQSLLLHRQTPSALPAPARENLAAIGCAASFAEAMFSETPTPT